MLLEIEAPAQAGALLVWGSMFTSGPQAEAPFTRLCRTSLVGWNAFHNPPDSLHFVEHVAPYAFFGIDPTIMTAPLAVRLPTMLN
jgi:hypothetical protein